jgi:hypothetical protein
VTMVITNMTSQPMWTNVRTSPVSEPISPT